MKYRVRYYIPNSTITWYGMNMFDSKETAENVGEKETEDLNRDRFDCMIHFEVVEWNFTK